MGNSEEKRVADLSCGASNGNSDWFLCKCLNSLILTNVAKADLDKSFISTQILSRLKANKINKPSIYNYFILPHEIITSALFKTK